MVWAIGLWIEVSLVFSKQLRFHLFGSGVFLCFAAGVFYLFHFRLKSNVLEDLNFEFSLYELCLKTIRADFCGLGCKDRSPFLEEAQNFVERLGRIGLTLEEGGSNLLRIR